MTMCATCHHGTAMFRPTEAFHRAKVARQVIHSTNIVCMLPCHQIADTWGLAESLGCPHNDLVGVLISLEAEDMLKSQLLQTMYFVVSDEGQGVRALWA